MRAPRSLIGKHGELVWRDPCSAHASSSMRDLSDLPKGREVLAVQKERGVSTDITEGVIRIEHTRGECSPLLAGPPMTDVSCTWVVEDLEESITIYEPVKESTQ